MIIIALAIIILVLLLGAAVVLAGFQVAFVGLLLLFVPMFRWILLGVLVAMGLTFLVVVVIWVVLPMMRERGSAWTNQESHLRDMKWTEAEIAEAKRLFHKRGKAYREYYEAKSAEVVRDFRRWLPKPP